MVCSSRATPKWRHPLWSALSPAGMGLHWTRLCSLSVILALRLTLVVARPAVYGQSVWLQNPHLNQRRVDVAGLPSGKASLALAVRQQLLDYAKDEGLSILQSVIYDTEIPPYETHMHVAVLGNVRIRLTNLQVQELVVPPNTTSLSIIDGAFIAQTNDAGANFSYTWTWEYKSLSGSGTGTCQLTGGAVQYIFTMNASQYQAPQIFVQFAAVQFAHIKLHVHSSSTDWLYQALMFIFHGALKSEVETLIVQALKEDVPSTVNQLLATLPASLSVTVLHFETVFSYAVYAEDFVLVQGYGQYVTRDKDGNSTCPFGITPFPVDSGSILNETRMWTLYAHETVINCLFWGLYEVGSLNTVIRDGDIPSFRLVTDLFAVLIPGLPKRYPHKGMEITVKFVEAPSISFVSGGYVQMMASYIEDIFVLNATGNGTDVNVATLACNVTLKANIQWDKTSVLLIDARHEVLQSNNFTVSVKVWDTVIKWLVGMLAPQYPLHKLVDKYVSTDVVSKVQIANAGASYYDSWYAFSADVVVNLTDHNAAPSRDMPTW